MSTFHNQSGFQAGVQNFYAPVYNGATSQGLSQERIPDVNDLQDAFDPDSNKLDNDIKAKLSFPEMFDRRNNLVQPHPHTCEWILSLKEFKLWKDSVCGLLWIKGKPGSGKSTLMAFLYHNLRKVDTTNKDEWIFLEFFFTAQGAELQQTPVGMLRSLLSQLFTQAESTRREIRTSFHEKQAAFGSHYHSWQWHLNELKFLFKNLVDQSAKCQKVMVFIDALDEAGEFAARELAGFFHSLNKEVTANGISQLKICISCRHYPIINTGPYTELSVEEFNRDDIRKFVDDRLEQKAYLVAEHPASQQAWKDLHFEIGQRSAGIFQFASLVTQMVEQKMDKGYPLSDIALLVDRLPVELRSVYHYILQLLMQDEERTESFLLFQWVCLAKEPLTLNQLSRALAIKNTELLSNSNKASTMCQFEEDRERMKLRIRSLSGGLIEVTTNYLGVDVRLPSITAHLSTLPPDMSGSKAESYGSESDAKVYNDYYNDRNEYVQVIHQTVSEYFFSEGLRLLTVSCDQRSSRVPTTETDNGEVVTLCHKTLFRSCLMHYLREDHQWPCHHERCKIMVLPKGSCVQQSPLLTYIISFMFDHLSEALPGMQDEVEQDLPLLEQAVKGGIWNEHIKEADIGEDIRDPCTILLAIASAKNWPSIYKCILNTRSNTSVKTWLRSHGIYWAVRHDDQAMAELYINAGASVDAEQFTMTSPLALATKENNIRMIEWILTRWPEGAQLTPSDNDSLRLALLNKSSSTFELLLQSRLDFNIRPSKFRNALGELVSTGDTESALYILQQLAEGGYLLGPELPLQRAVETNRMDVVKLLLNAGASVHGLGGNLSPLHAAVTHRHIAMVHLLLDSGADIESREGNYTTPLIHAMMSRNVDIIEELLSRGADPSNPDADENTPLHYSVRSRLSRIFTQLLSKGVDVNARNCFGETSLDLAICLGYVDFVEKLIDAGAKPSFFNIGAAIILCYALSGPEYSALNNAVSIATAETLNSLRLCTLGMSVHNLARSLLTTKDLRISPGLWELGRCLGYLGELANAKFAFHIRMIIKDLLHDKVPHVTCSQCQFSPWPTASICFSCLDVALCPICVIKHERGDPVEARSHSHDLLKIDCVAGKNEPWLGFWEPVYVVDSRKSAISQSSELTVSESHASQQSPILQIADSGSVRRLPDTMKTPPDNVKRWLERLYEHYKPAQNSQIAQRVSTWCEQRGAAPDSRLTASSSAPSRVEVHKIGIDALLQH